MLRSGLLVALSLIGLLTAGCEKVVKRYEVSGKITYQGQPIPAGIIYFDPDIAAGGKGLQGFAVIKDGTYDTRVEGGLGPVGGKYVLRIHGNNGIPEPELVMGRPLFGEITIPKELPAADTQLEDIDVPLQSP
ncbi:hypothetical protein ETAA8_42000 [Anatilimnocola aggregata]|uniref:Uncharacterized protein n=1 Tax=Anatilimnocola aggregata TaxID=2528021 RepID=A0A517YFT6_9BACT|nr:hypothetical protein [Anatilimnocola aggregata]QDU29093.1 hypothetical protein ETAA8_42000 [Anatilimnocola aggregata]